MKLFATIAAGLITMLGVAPAQAEAQVHRDRTTTVVTTKQVVHNNRGHQRVRSRGYRNKRVCRTVWRNHHRQRVCRTVRVRR